MFLLAQLCFQLSDENLRLQEQLDRFKAGQNAAEKKEELWQENLANLEKNLVIEKSKHQTEVTEWEIKTVSLT